MFYVLTTVNILLPYPIYYIHSTILGIQTTSDIIIMGLVSDYHNKENISIKWVIWIFGFPIHKKVMFPPYNSSIKYEIVLCLKNVYILALMLMPADW